MQPLASVLFILFNKGCSGGTFRIKKSFVNAEGRYWYHSQLMCLFLLMINGSVVYSSGIEPPALHNHLWIDPRVLIVNISAFTGHQNFSRKIDLVNSSLQQKTRGKNKTVFRG